MSGSMERSPAEAADVGSSGGGPVAVRLDRAGFEREFQAAHRALWCIAAGVTGDRDLAADIVQQSALVALGKLGEFEVGTSFLSWMARIVRWTAMNERRKRTRQRTAGVEPHVLDASPASGGTKTSSAASPGGAEGSAAAVAGVSSVGAFEADEAGFDDRMVRALHGLAEEARACLLLRVVLELSYKEISLALDVPEGTAMSHVHRSRRYLRGVMMGPQGGGR